MIKTIIIITIISLGASFNSYADDSERIYQLEKEVRELESRILKLESLLGGTSESKKTFPSHEGWKSLSNWRKLSGSMGYDEVRNILGEPQRIEGGVVAIWYYQNGGNVTFVNNQITAWEEPR